MSTRLIDIPAGKKSEQSALPGRGWQVQPLVWLVLAFLAAVLFIGPGGNFPLNDDWIYGEAVKHIAQTGELRLGPSCAACYGVLAAGALVSKVLGFSYTHLRMVTLLFSLAGMLFVYGAARESGLQRRGATLVAAVYSFNPLILHLSFTFMTDVAALSMTNAYLYFALRGVRRNSERSLWLSGLMLALAVSVRQIAVIFVLINLLVGIAYWLRRRNSWAVLFGMVALPSGMYYGAGRLLKATSLYPDHINWYQEHFASVIQAFMHAPLNSVFPLAINLGEVCFYLGLFCLPVTVLFLPLLTGLFRKSMRLAAIWFAGSAGLVVSTLTSVVAHGQRWMPFNQNLLRIPVVGPLTIMGVNFATISDRYRRILTWISGLSAFIVLSLYGSGLATALGLLMRGYLRAGRDSETGERLWRRGLLSCLCFGATAVSLGFVCFQMRVLDLDRYYLLPFPLFLISLCFSLRWMRVRGRVLWLVAWAVLIAGGAYSVCAAQDYMSWNRARYGLAFRAEQSGIPSRQIDGGAEFNFWRDESLTESLQLDATTHGFVNLGAPPRDKWRWWPINSEKYIIAFNTVPGYEIQAEKTYWSALSFGTKRVLLLKQTPEEAEASKLRLEERQGFSSSQ